MASTATSIRQFNKTADELPQWPDFIQQRMVMFDQLMEEYKQELANKPRTPIKITMPNGNILEGKAWETTPFSIAKGISKSLANATVIAKVNDELWDLDRPLEGDVCLKFLKFDEDDEAKQVYWHSSAHILGEACERYCGGHLCYGPPIAEGFYYDMFTDGATMVPDDLLKLKKISDAVIKDKQTFERLEMKKEDLLKMFAYNKFKVRILEEKVTSPKTTVYRCGPLIDLCRGPHVQNTGKIKAIQVIKASSSYWGGNAEAESLQRVYGISFPSTDQLKEWVRFQEEAAQRDHRKIGRDQNLYFFNTLSPGSAFWYPNGTFIYNALVNCIKREYRKRGFQEVISPNIYNANLWKKSGHWDHYADNMFRFEVENEEFALKPMNCPGHCLMFDHQPRTYNHLPIRFADFGVLHRNEMSGALTGLTRVRRFQQDDGHIFCRKDQIADEIGGCLAFLNRVYTEIFDFSFKLQLSTRPEKDYLGDIETWDNAESQLKQALDKSGYAWTLNPGDGAFYGPKIDISIEDALRRSYQCATIQLDFQLPQRFDLNYFDENGVAVRPVIIHRAVLGSVERMTAILSENYGGKWPFWLSPRQAKVIAVHKAQNPYAEKVRAQIFDAGFEVDFSPDTSDTLNKQIRTAELERYNFILVVGPKEVENETVNVRTRGQVTHGEVKVGKLIEKFHYFVKEYSREAENKDTFDKAAA